MIMKVVITKATSPELALCLSHGLTISAVESGQQQRHHQVLDDARPWCRGSRWSAWPCASRGHEADPRLLARFRAEALDRRVRGDRVGQRPADARIQRHRRRFAFMHVEAAELTVMAM